MNAPTTAPRSVLRLPAQPAARPAPIPLYNRAFMLHIGRKLAASAAARRAELRARAAAVGVCA
jgi:hypothetical protein